MWKLKGACRGVSASLFFPDRGQSTMPAKRICYSCPVMDDCREYALTLNPVVGVWGGLSEAELNAEKALRKENE